MTNAFGYTQARIHPSSTDLVETGCDPITILHDASSRQNPNTETIRSSPIPLCTPQSGEHGLRPRSTKVRSPLSGSTASHPHEHTSLYPKEHVLNKYCKGGKRSAQSARPALEHSTVEHAPAARKRLLNSLAPSHCNRPARYSSPLQPLPKILLVVVVLHVMSTLRLLPAEHRVDRRQWQA